MAQISIIIPVYNGERYLEECLQSVADQTFGDFEVLVVNDGSTDSSKEIARRFAEKDPRFQLIDIKNSGVSKARNTGIDKATGRYLTFVDSDDCLHPTALERMASLLEKEDASVCVCTYSTGLEFSIGEIARKTPERYSYKSAMKRALYQSRIMNSAWGVLFERDLLRPNIRFREGIRYEDLDAFYRFYEKAKKIIFIDEPLYFYRNNEKSFIHTWSVERLDVLDVTDRIVEYVRERYPSLLKAANDRRFSAHYNILLLMLSNNITDRVALARCLKVIKQNRMKILLDPHVRLKNKIGALVSYGGLKSIRFFVTGNE